MARLESECWLRFWPSLDVFATPFAGSSPSEFVDVCYCKILELFAGYSLGARLASSSPQPSPSEQADECILFLGPLPFSCAFIFYYFMPNSCTITHKSKVPRSRIIVLQFIKNEGGFEHISKEME